MSSMVLIVVGVFFFFLSPLSLFFNQQTDMFTGQVYGRSCGCKTRAAHVAPEWNLPLLRIYSLSFWSVSLTTSSYLQQIRSRLRNTLTDGTSERYN